MKKLLVFLFLFGWYLNGSATFAEPSFKLCEDVAHEGTVVDIALPVQLDIFCEKTSTIIERELINDTRPLDDVHFTDEQQIQFRNEPTLSLGEWVKHLFRPRGDFQLSSRMAFYAIIYLKRLRDKKMKIGWYNIRRLFMIGCLIAYKTFDDDACRRRVIGLWFNTILGPLNVHYSIKLLKLMELEILGILGWKTEVRVPEMDWFLRLYFPYRRP